MDRKPLTMNTPENYRFHPLTDHTDITITLDELMEKVPARSASKLRPMAATVLESVRGVWRPKAVGTWLDVNWIRGDAASFSREGLGKTISLNLGFSIQFLKPAQKALTAVYTVGSDLEAATHAASTTGRLLEAWLIDIIGLIVLDKAGDQVRHQAEVRARELGWGTGPFLSPGSVHGWELEEQATLCSVLPLQDIGVELRQDGVLSPFKTISCLLPIGPGYTRTRVGPTCQVCSRNETCEMRQGIHPLS